MMRLREEGLRLDRVDQGEGEQITLTGEPAITLLKSFLAHMLVGRCGDQAPLPHHIQRASRRLHRAKRNARHNLLIQIVLPVANFRLESIEQRLLRTGKDMCRVAPDTGYCKAVST